MLIGQCRQCAVVVPIRKQDVWVPSMLDLFPHHGRMANPLFDPRRYGHDATPACRVRICTYIQIREQRHTVFSCRPQYCLSPAQWCGICALHDAQSLRSHCIFWPLGSFLLLQSFKGSSLLSRLASASLRLIVGAEIRKPQAAGFRFASRYRPPRPVPDPTTFLIGRFRSPRVPPAQGCASVSVDIASPCACPTVSDTTRAANFFLTLCLRRESLTPSHYDRLHAS